MITDMRMADENADVEPSVATTSDTWSSAAATEPMAASEIASPPKLNTSNTIGTSGTVDTIDTAGTIGTSMVTSNVVTPHASEHRTAEEMSADQGFLDQVFTHQEPSVPSHYPSGSPVWFGPEDQPLRGWLHRPPLNNGGSSRRVVIVPGFGYEELTSGWGLRNLAEELADAGHTVLRYDHPGTGDSSGDDPTVASWLQGVHHAVSALNFPDVTLIGVRLGATLALAAASTYGSDHSNALGSQDLDDVTSSPADSPKATLGKPFANGAITQVFAVSPVVSGRRMMRELTMLAATKKAVAPTSSEGGFAAGPLEPTWAAPTVTLKSSTLSTSPSSLSRSESSSEGAPLVVGGFVYSDALRAGLSSLDLLSLTASPAPLVEIIHAFERSTDKNFATYLRSLGTAVYESSVEGISTWLDTSSELAIAPRPLIDLLKRQLFGESMVDADELTDFHNTDRSFTSTSTVRINGKTLRERAFVLGEPSLSAIVVEPIDPLAKPTVAVLLLNSGVERNIGPGRAWVSWSRSLAGAGHTVLRLDLSGVGNSGTWPGKPAFHTYRPETFDDVALGIAELRAMGHQKIVMVGLCASAFSALGAKVDPSVVGIVSLSPQLYRCGTPGSMAEVEDTNFNRHRISQLDQKFNLRRKGAAVEELMGKRHLSISWIEAWLAQGTLIRLVFGPEDRGLRFLQWRAPRSLKQLAKTSTFALHIHPTLDHALHEAPARDQVFSDLCDLLSTLS
jgi:pimeloyl-ACP methyl ester carboxylesterase